MLYAIVAAIILIADQWLKYTVTVNITLATGSQELIPGVVRLVNIHNNGAAFSFLGDLAFSRWLFLGIAALFVLLVVIMLIKRSFTSKFAIWCAVLAMAGAIGNCIDRVLYGYVVDMIKLEFVNFAVFNVADIVLVVSCLCFIIFLIVDIFSHPASENEKADKAAAKEKRSGRKAEEEPEDGIAVIGIVSDAPDFPEGSTPIMRDAKPAVSDDFWASFSRDTGLPSATEPVRKAEPKPEPMVERKAERRPEHQPRVERRPEPKPQPKPEPPKAAPAEPEYDLESILAEFLS